MSIFHRNIIDIFSIVCIVLFAWGVEAESYSNSKFVPPDGKSLVIIGQQVNEIDDYVSSVGPTPAGLMGYTSIWDLEGIFSPSDRGGGMQHAQYLVNRYPNTVMQVGLYMAGALDATIAGSYNANIDSFGNWAKSTDRPIYLRIGYEFDGAHNNYEPSKYVQAYRHIVDRLESNGVNNVAYVWHSHANTTTRPVMDWYPGDEYVDWFAISFFGQVNYYMDAMAQLAEQHGKPLMIAESSPHGIGTLDGELSWNAWFQVYFDFIKEKNVKGLSYINCDWDAFWIYYGQGLDNARVQDNDFVLEQWLKELNNEMYLHSSDTLYADLGYQSIPEPTTLLLTGCGLFMLYGKFKKNKLRKR